MRVAFLCGIAVISSIAGLMEIGAAENQTARPASVFGPALTEVVGHTTVPIVLPARLPSTIRTSEIKAAWGEATATTYYISLHYENDGADAFFAAGFGGRREPATRFRSSFVPTCRFGEGVFDGAEVARYRRMAWHGTSVSYLGRRRRAINTIPITTNVAPIATERARAMNTTPTAMSARPPAVDLLIASRLLFAVYFPASRLPTLIAASNPRLSLIAFTCALFRAGSCRMNPMYAP
jgi:hypothetical protein